MKMKLHIWCPGKLLVVAAVVLATEVGVLSAVEPPVVAPSVDFAREVLPILSNKCFICHGPDSNEDGQLRLDTFEGATEVRSGYQAINPKMPQQSELLARINSIADNKSSTWVKVLIALPSPRILRTELSRSAFNISLWIRPSLRFIRGP